MFEDFTSTYIIHPNSDRQQVTLRLANTIYLRASYICSDPQY